MVEKAGDFSRCKHDISAVKASSFHHGKPLRSTLLFQFVLVHPWQHSQHRHPGTTHIVPSQSFQSAPSSVTCPLARLSSVPRCFHYDVCLVPKKCTVHASWEAKCLCNFLHSQLVEWCRSQVLPFLYVHGCLVCNPHS